MRFTRYFSEKNQSYYWYNDFTKKYHYDKPQEIIEKEKEYNNCINDYWIKKKSTKQNKNYWINERTCEYSWIDPSNFSDELKPIQEENCKLSGKQRLIERTKKLKKLRELKRINESNEKDNLTKDLTTVFNKIEISEKSGYDPESESEKKDSPKLPINPLQIIPQKIPEVKKQPKVSYSSDDNEYMAVNSYGMACSVKGRTDEERLESLRDLNEALRDMYRR